MRRRILSLLPSTLLIPLRLCDKSPSHWQNTDKEHCIIQWWLRRLTAANAAERGCSSNPLLPTCRATKAGERHTRAAGRGMLTALIASACHHLLFPKAMGSIWPVTRQVYFWQLFILYSLFLSLQSTHANLCIEAAVTKLQFTGLH